MQRRLLFQITTLEVGGAERRCILLANAAVESGYRVRIVTHGPHWAQRDLLRPEVELHPMTAHLSPSRRALYVGTYRAVREFRPHVIHSFGLGFPVVAMRLAGTHRLIASVISPAPSGERANATIGRLRLCARAADIITANSRGSYDSWASKARMPASKLVLIPNFVDVSRCAVWEPAARAAVRAELGLNDDHRVFCLVARLSPEKRHTDVLTALAQAGPTLRGARVVFVGEGPERVRLTAQVAALGLGAQATLLGQRSDVLRLLQGMDVFLLPSDFEGMPNALLEAMACGLPAIGTQVPGTEDLLRPGENGWLVPPRDPAALAHAMVEAAADPVRRLAYGRAARLLVEAEYDLPVVTQRYLDLYAGDGPLPKAVSGGRADV